MQLSHEILIYSRKEQVTNEDIQKYLPKLVNEFNINIHQVQNCPKNIYHLLNPSKNIVFLKQDRQLATEPKKSFENISFINQFRFIESILFKEYRKCRIYVSKIIKK